MLALSGIKVARHLKESSSLQLLLLSFGRVTGNDLFVKIAKVGQDGRVASNLVWENLVPDFQLG